MLESVLRRNSNKNHLFDKERRQTHNGFSQIEKLFRNKGVEFFFPRATTAAEAAAVEDTTAGIIQIVVAHCVIQVPID